MDVVKQSNLFLFKCYKRVFSRQGLDKNSGSYINITMTAVIIFYSIFFVVKGYSLYQKKLQRMIRQQTIQKNADFINIKELNKPNKDDKLKYEINSLRDFNISDASKCSNNSNNTNNPNILNNKGYSPSKNDLKDKSIKPFNDFEMINLEYEEALVKDKRCCCPILISFFKLSQPIYFTFILENDYNSKIIKICLFIFSLCLGYAVNAIFFYDDTMHKIEEDRGKYNIVYQLPQIIYSFVISAIVTKIVSCFILSEGNISKIIKRKKSEKNIINNLFRCLKCKFAIFFVLITLFHLLFWYYLSSFCAVYKNTQGALIINTIESIFLSLFLYPLIICLILGVMRSCSLWAQNKDLYNFTKKLGDFIL